MTRLLSALVLSAACLPVLPAAAQGNPNCADRAQVLQRLASTYGESRQSVGLAANNTVVELFASAETGSWTITVTLPSGLTCLVAAGQGYEHVGETLVGGEDA